MLAGFEFSNEDLDEINSVYAACCFLSQPPPPKRYCACGRKLNIHNKTDRCMPCQKKLLQLKLLKPPFIPPKSKLATLPSGRRRLTPLPKGAK